MYFVPGGDIGWVGESLRVDGVVARGDVQPEADQTVAGVYRAIDAQALVKVT